MTAWASTRQKPAKSLWDAARNGDTHGVRAFVLEQDVYINSKDKLGNTAVIWAAYGGHRHTMQELVALGADVNMKTRVRLRTARCTVRLC